MMKLQKSYVCLEHLRFHAYHGVFQQERMVGNDYDVNLRLGYPLATAMQSDRVEDTLNYATVFQLVKEEMEKPSSLLENVAQRIVMVLTKTFCQIGSIDLKITKINPPMGADCKGAGVEIHVINEKTET